MSKLSLLILLFVGSFHLYAQNLVPKGYVVDITIENGDTLPQMYIPEVIIIPEYKFVSEKQKRQYTRLVLNIKKVYPYARMANDKLKEIENKVDSLGNRKNAKDYIKQVDKELQARYGDELKKLTINQGRILIKLIDRDTGSTSYDLVKELRGTFSAFMWQSLARLFGENLKEEYDAEGEDRMIEHIVLKIEAGQI
jgi:hypothetical protein